MKIKKVLGIVGAAAMNPEVIEGFVNALQKGMDYVNTHTPEEIAKVKNSYTGQALKSVLGG